MSKSSDKLYKPSLAMLRSLILFGSLIWTLNATPIEEPERHQVIVVGAGVSGLTAAATLLANNITDVLILEAADRIGGRTNTVEFGGTAIDKGAEFVHGQGGNAVYDLIKPFDLLVSYDNLTQQIDQLSYVNTSGHVFNSSLAYYLFDEGTKILYEEGPKSVNESLFEKFNHRYEEFLRSEGVDHSLGEGMRHVILLEEGVHSGMGYIDILGPSEFEGYWPCEGDLSLKWKTGGYKTLYDFITKKFPNPDEELPVLNNTLLHKQVTHVERREKDVKVSCADGSTYLADHVIVTVSLGVLKKHAATMFHPALSTEKTTAIEKLGIGCVGKVFLLFPNRWWPNDITTFSPVLSEKEIELVKANFEQGYWVVNASTFSPTINNDRILCAWFSGDACRTMESLSDEQIIEGLTEYLRQLLGHKYNITRPESILRTNWASNPFTLGAYSYRTREGDADNITGDVLAEPIVQDGVPVVLFAGEATHAHYFSTVHGALETGRREANRIIDYLKDNPKS